jgi:oxygen-dependent protoporphyrinogen oxidase
MARVAVVGAGAAGLSAACKLHELGVQVAVFEQANAPGGRARSELLEGCVVDVGAQLFGSGFSSLFSFAARVGAGGLLRRSPGRDALWRGGRLHHITYGNVASMVTSSALPATLKLKLGARYVPFLFRHAGPLDPGEPLARGGDALEGESVAQWGRRELGDDFVELLAYPLLGAYYGSAPEDTGVVLYHALARAGLDVSVHAVQGGIGALFQTAVGFLRERGASLELGRGVARVESTGDGVLIDGAVFDGAVLALPPRSLQQILVTDAVTGEWLNGVRYAPSAVLALVLRERIPGNYFGASIPRTERGSDLVAICAQHQKLPGLVPEDRALLICLGAPAANAGLIADPQAAVPRMIDAVEQLMPGTRALVTRAKLYRHLDGYPLFYPGYLKHLRDFPWGALPERIMLAGDYLMSPTVEGAIRSGERAAERLLVQLRAA